MIASQLCADSTSPLNFTAVNGPATVKLGKGGSNPDAISLQYSTDNCATWLDYTIGQDIQLASGAKVYFKATSSNANFSKDINNCYRFDMTGTIAADGNIMSLLDATMQQTSVPDYAFCRLFEGCSSLTQAPALPATTLAEGCYYCMFKGCTSLTQAPALPATILAVRCYENMFLSCYSLIVNTEGPGTPWRIPDNATPADGWNTDMFEGTGGNFTGNPEIGVTYYIASDTTTTTNVENVKNADYVVYSDHGRIFVNGAAGAPASVYDVNGRLVATTDKADETHEFDVETAGIYFVRINDRESVKVIVK